ncbi:Exodeoxyribonuclease 7 large subunit (fragment) [Crenothrix polyspora]|uniref:Exodeoxyribonuclease 7 large subunit n=1 Tax=Crenothrix polyspora TaxID=360316 RepID=A0A1R4HBL9_9GAMM
MLTNTQRVDDLEGRLYRVLQTKLRACGSILDMKTAKLWQYAPTALINSHKQRQVYLENRLIQAIQYTLEQREQQLLNASQTLNTLSPLATLNRGYAIASHHLSGGLIRSTEQVKIGDMIQIRLAQGHFTSQIKDISHD